MMNMSVDVVSPCTIMTDSPAELPRLKRCRPRPRPSSVEKP
jgi:hypothetical protein